MTAGGYCFDFSQKAFFLESVKQILVYLERFDFRWNMPQIMAFAPDFKHHDPQIEKMPSQHSIRFQVDLEAVGSLIGFLVHEDKATTVVDFDESLQVVDAECQDVQNTVLAKRFWDSIMENVELIYCVSLFKNPGVDIGEKQNGNSQNFQRVFRSFVSKLLGRTG